jgi:hypothetical protein
MQLPLLFLQVPYLKDASVCTETTVICQKRAGCFLCGKCQLALLMASRRSLIFGVTRQMYLSHAVLCVPYARFQLGQF